MPRGQENKACPQFEEDLVLYHYGDLESAARATIETHTAACTGCRNYLNEIRTILPLTTAQDEPPEAFWIAYSREMRHKLDTADRRGSRRERLARFFTPRWGLPAFAAAAVIAVAIGFTIGADTMRSGDVPASDRALMEALPVAEKLDFFRNMEVLDSMELLEAPGTANGNV